MSFEVDATKTKNILACVPSLKILVLSAEAKLGCAPTKVDNDQHLRRQVWCAWDEVDPQQGKEGIMARHGRLV